MYGGSRSLAIVALGALVAVAAGCAGSSETLSGEQVADQLVPALQGTQFYQSASRAKCEAVEMKAGAISDCTVWFRQGIFMGDTRRQHSVRVTMADEQGHFSYWVAD